jgi:hypothetical protein
MPEDKSRGDWHIANQNDLLRKHIFYNFELKMTFFCFIEHRNIGSYFSLKTVLIAI